MESLRPNLESNPAPRSIEEWTPEELEEAYFYNEERLPKSELYAGALMAIEAEQQRRKELMKG